MKKLLFIVVCCLMLCGCENSKKEKMIYCISESSNKELNIQYSKEEYFMYFDDDDLTSKICNQKTTVYQTIEDATKQYELEKILNDNHIELKDNSIIVDYNCNENPIEKQNINKTKNEYEKLDFKCQILYSNE